MNWESDKRVLEERLARCRELARDFPAGLTAEHLRDIEAELLDDLRALEESSLHVRCS